MSSNLRLLYRYVDTAVENISYSVYNGTNGTVSTTTSGIVYGQDPYVRNYQTRNGGGYDTATLVLFILFITFSTCMVLMRIFCYPNSNNRDLSGNIDDPSNHVRTQECIEKMLVLKKVLVTVNDPSKDVEKATQGEAMIQKRIKRRKSNLLLTSGGGDELDKSRTCAICLCEYENGESICWSHNRQCAHHFHSECGIAWLSKHSECPICRANYLVEPGDLDDVPVVDGEEAKPMEDNHDANSTALASSSSIFVQQPQVTIFEGEEDESEPSTNSSDDDPLPTQTQAINGGDQSV